MKDPSPSYLWPTIPGALLRERARWFGIGMLAGACLTVFVGAVLISHGVC